MSRISPAYWMAMPEEEEEASTPRLDQFYIRDRKTGFMRRLELAYVAPTGDDEDEDEDDDMPSSMQ